MKKSTRIRGGSGMVKWVWELRHEKAQRERWAIHQVEVEETLWQSHSRILSEYSGMHPTNVSIFCFGIKEGIGELSLPIPSLLAHSTVISRPSGAHPFCERTLRPPSSPRRVKKLQCRPRGPRLKPLRHHLRWRMPAPVVSSMIAAPLMPVNCSSVVPTPWEPSISAFLTSVLLRGAPGCTSSRCAVWPAFCPTKSKRQRLDAAAWVEAGPKQVAAAAVIMVRLWFISHSSLKKGFEIDGVPIPVRTLTARVVHYHWPLWPFVFGRTYVHRWIYTLQSVVAPTGSELCS